MLMNIDHVMLGNSVPGILIGLYSLDRVTQSDRQTAIQKPCIVQQPGLVVIVINDICVLHPRAPFERSAQDDQLRQPGSGHDASLVPACSGYLLQVV